MAEETTENPSFLNPSRRSYMYESSKGSGNKKRVILIIAGVIILIALVAYAILATGGKGEGEKNLTPTPVQPTSAPTPSETLTPTSAKGAPTVTPKASLTPAKTTLTPSPAKGTPTPTTTSGLDRANLKVAVLNGSGTTGAGAKMSDLLKKLGYDVVSTGNADNSDYAKTVIQVKSTKKTYLDLLKQDLSSTYTIGTATADYSGSDSDGVVIVGKE